MAALVVVGVALCEGPTVGYHATYAAVYSVALGVTFDLVISVRDFVTDRVWTDAGYFVAVGVWLLVAGILREAVKSGQPSLASKLVLVVLLLAYSVLIWIYLLGGY